MVGLSDEPLLRVRRGVDWAVETLGQVRADLGTRVPHPSGDDGVFASWRWDGQRLTVQNDRLGAFPIFYSITPDWAMVSPSITQLLSLGAPPQLDDDAVAVFLALGFYLGEETAFRSIRMLPPNARLDWQPGRGATITADRLVVPPSGLSRDAALDAEIELFRAAMERRLPADGSSPVALPVSGGKDSRHILLEMLRQGRRPRLCVTVDTFADYVSDDVEIARRLCQRVGVPHQVASQVGRRLPAEMEKNVRCGFLADEHAWYLRLRDAIPQGAIVHDGMLGALIGRVKLLSPQRLHMLESGQFERLARSISRRARGLRRSLTPEARRRFAVDRAVARISAAIQAELGSANPLGTFWFWGRTRRELALPPLCLLDGPAAVHFPFLDHDHVDLLLSLPATFFSDGHFHHDAIVRAYPDVADVPFSELSAMGWGDGRRDRRLCWDVATYATRGTEELIDKRYVTRTFRRLALSGDGAAMDAHDIPTLVNLLQLERTV